MYKKRVFLPYSEPTFSNQLKLCFYDYDKFSDDFLFGSAVIKKIGTKFNFPLIKIFSLLHYFWIELIKYK